MLLGNYNVFSKHPGRDIGGGATGLGYNRGDFNKTSMSRAVYCEPTWDPMSSLPEGCRPPSTWLMPQTGGGLSSRNIISGSGSLAASGALGRNIVGALDGSGGLSATGALIVSAIAALSGSGSISTADLLAVLQAAAALSGSGTVASADIGAIGWILADLDGEGDVSGVSYAIGNMLADIQPFTALSPQSLAAAVWSAIAADNNETGTMGEKVNDAGSASNPWTEVIEGSYTAAELLRIISAAVAGSLSGADTTTITIVGVDRATDRIIATVDTHGNRTSVTLDGS